MQVLLTAPAAPLLASAAPRGLALTPAQPAQPAQPAPAGPVQWPNQASDPAESVTAGRPTEATPLFPTGRPGLRSILKSTQKPSL